MAVLRITTPTSNPSTELSVTINNGDFQALKKIAQGYGITDEKDVVTFAIGVLSKASGKPVAIEKQDGSTEKFLPSESLKTGTISS